MEVILTLFLAFIPLAFSVLQPCTVDKGPLPKSVTIVNCDNNEDCDFVRGKSVIGDFEFVALTDITSLTPFVYMTLGKNRMTKADTDIPFDRILGCDWLLEGYSCPVTKGKTLKWRLNLPISSMETITQATIEIAMRSQDNTTQFCAQIWGNVYPLK
ncbi:hypothetical protein PVAND_002463 [Polypedilum vanderplanki]|uniref:MD-2-related lipid-recognition domain-containing protein n=1 Tax=Polypedilum vanderplanki TaxID=319348 RepID=A0A9J6BR31_POLVA|nr:hypothetical protein PVAND_002463 [Polypedilum vanderplanki]